MFVAHPVTLLYAAICWQGKVTRFNTSLTVAGSLWVQSYVSFLLSLLLHFMLIRFVFIVADFTALEILVFFQQDAGSLPTMNGLRRQPTCWAAPWMSCPLWSLRTRPGECSRCSEGARMMLVQVTTQVKTTSFKAWSCLWCWLLVRSVYNSWNGLH